LLPEASLRWCSTRFTNTVLPLQVASPARTAAAQPPLATTGAVSTGTVPASLIKGKSSGLRATAGKQFIQLTLSQIGRERSQEKQLYAGSGFLVWPPRQLFAESPA
jgi:hypothetical protein